MNIGVFAIFGMCCIVGMALDMFTSVFGLIALADHDFWVARVLVGGLGIIMTLGAAGTKFVLQRQVPAILVFLWAFCMLGDIVTNILSLNHFLVEAKQFGDNVTIGPSAIRAALKSEPGRGLLALAIMVCISTCTIGGAYSLDALNRHTQKPPQK